MRLASRGGLAAAALAIVAAGAPAAAARTDLNPERSVTPAQVGSGLLSGTTPDPPGAAQHEAQIFRRIYDRANIQGAPPILRPARHSELRAIHDAEAQEALRLSYVLPTARYGNAEMNAYASAVNPVPLSASTASAGDGFDYGDAAVGVGIAGGVALLITGGTLSVRRHGDVRHA